MWEMRLQQLYSKKSRQRKMWVLHKPVWAGAIAVLLFTVMIVVYCTVIDGRPDFIQARFDILPDANAMDGSLHPGKREPVPEGEYQVVMNQIPTLTYGSRKCNIEFENPPENHYSARISLYLKESGEYLGGTRRVDQGKYVQYIELNRQLDPGEYPVLADIELFTGEEASGNMVLEIMVRVTSE